MSRSDLVREWQNPPVSAGREGLSLLADETQTAPHWGLLSGKNVLFQVVFLLQHLFSPQSQRPSLEAGAASVTAPGLKLVFI